MKISFYGALAETIGREIEVTLTHGATVAAVRAQLIALYPAAADTLRRTSVRAYVDDVMVGEDAAIPGGATLAFLPPLSGG